MNTPLPPDPYRALGVDTSADAASIKTAYRKLVLKCHPDKFLDPAIKATKQEEFQKVQQAYEILGDDDKRREYDLEVKARRLREELYNNGPASGTPPKKYYNVNIRTAEPPASFAAPQPPPPPKKGYSPYPQPQPQFSQSWDSRDIPHRPSKQPTFEEKTTRRAPSYEKPKIREEDLKEERRRRRDEDRDKERERERREEREREREREREDYIKEKEKERRREEKRERERKEEKDRQRAEAERREKEMIKAEKKRAEREREKERDKAQRRAQEEKFRSKSKHPYIENYSQSEEDIQPKSTKKSSSSSKKHSESPPREKSSRKERDRSAPRVAREEKLQDNLAFAADYMDMARRKVPKVPTSPYGDQPVPNYAQAYPDPDQWTGPPRRGSHDAKYPAKGDPVIIDTGSPLHKGPDVVNVAPRGEPVIPGLRKAYTSPPGTMAQPPISAAPPRMPMMHRAQTMQPEYARDRGQAQAPPATEKYSRHSERRRRNSFDDYLEEDTYDLPPRSSGHHRSSKAAGQSYVKVYHVDEKEPRVSEARYDDQYYSNNGSFPKIKVSHQIRPEQIYTAKRYTEDDVSYSNQAHTAAPYSQQYTHAY